MASIRFNGIKKTYPDKIRAIDNIDLDVNDGEFLVIVGPSGCGKTTILRLIAGLEKPSSGEILFDGFNIKNISAKDRNCAMVFQDAILYPHMNVYNNIAFPLKMRKYSSSEIKDKINHASKLLDIDGLMNRKPNTLSGGQRQRVALAKAMVRKPNVFLYDEPLSNLESLLRNQLKSEIVNLHKKTKTTTIYVTHDQSEAMTMGDKICLIKDGSIQQVATPYEMYNKPENVFVSRFFGIPSVNLISGLLKKEDETIEFETEDASFVLPATFNDYLQEHVNQQLIMAIRPEDIFPEPIESYHGSSLPVDIYSRQLTGSHYNILMKTPAGNNMSMTVNHDFAQMLEEQIIVYLNIQKAHFFNPEMGGINIKTHYERRMEDENA